MLPLKREFAGQRRTATVKAGIGYIRIPVSTKIIAAEREMADAGTALWKAKNAPLMGLANKFDLFG